MPLTNMDGIVMENGRTDEQWNCRIDVSGRVVLPLPVRQKKDLQDGDELVVKIEDGAIVLRSYEDAMQRLQDAFCADIPADVSLASELISERRQEAKREARH